MTTDLTEVPVAAVRFLREKAVRPTLNAAWAKPRCGVAPSQEIFSGGAVPSCARIFFFEKRPPQPSAMPRSATDLPPFVLVHGAFHGAWCWSSVAALLRSAGHEVFAPTLTGLGERRHLLSATVTIETFVLDVLNVIEFEQLQNLVLVGHSFGARPVCGVADRVPHRIRRLIFLDGALAPDGLSKLDAMPAAARAARIQAAMDFDGGLSIPPPPPEYFGITDPELAVQVAARLTPQPLGAERTGLALRHPIGNGRPVTYVRCTNPPHASTAPGAAFARSRQDWRMLELPTGHDCVLTDPERVASLLHDESLR